MTNCTFIFHFVSHSLFTLFCHVTTEGLKYVQLESNTFMLLLSYVTLDHKSSHKGQFFNIEIYTSSESWVNNWCMVYDSTIFGRDTTIWKSGIWECKKIQILRKIAFKVVQMKSLAMHITNQKLNFDIFTVDLYLIS